MTYIWDTSYNKAWVNSPRTGRSGDILVAASTGLGQSITEHGEPCFYAVTSYVMSKMPNPWTSKAQPEGKLNGECERDQQGNCSVEIEFKESVARTMDYAFGSHQLPKWLWLPSSIWKEECWPEDHFVCRHLSKGRIISRRGQGEDIREMGGVRMGAGLEKVAAKLQTVKLRNWCCTEKKTRARAHRRQRHSSPFDNFWKSTSRTQTLKCHWLEVAARADT